MATETLAHRAFATICRGLGQQLDQEDFCDVTVVVGKIEFSCHRAVLASVSEFFRTSLKPYWREASNRRVEITHEDVSLESFGYLMDILYKGEDVTNYETAKNILKMSVYLQIDFLQDYCTEYLQTNLKPEFCLETWQFAQKYDLDTLAEKSFEMAVDKIFSVSQQEELLTLPKSMLLIILSEQKKLSMDDVCRTILRWVEADQEARQIQLLELLPFVCFPRLSLGYLCDLVSYLNHPFSKILFENVHEGLNYNIKVQQTKDVTLQRKILARQPVLLNLPEVQTRVVMFGGYTEASKPIRDTHVFDLSNIFMKRYSLAPMPEDIGLDFASCTWYNEVYVSGGTQMPTFFAVYKPGDNEWEVLPSLPDYGREKHAMAAISCNIYVLGGLKKDSDGKTTISLSVMRYNTRTREWSIFSQLPSGVQEASAAALGHRIYLFGGVDAEGNNSSLVQCVDTLSSCSYEAGRLPSPTCGARALSNGGRIYVVRPKGDVLCMWESFPLAEQIEKKMSEWKEEGKDQPSDTNGSTVSFREVSKFTGRRHFGACLRAGEITVCGGESESGEVLDSFVKIPLEGRDISNKFLTLITKAAKFDLHEINIPVIYLKEETSVVQPFRVGDRVILDREENQRRMRQGAFMQHTAQPQGTGVITAVEASMITVDFAPYYYGWRGQAHQLQHA